MNRNLLAVFFVILTVSLAVGCYLYGCAHRPPGQKMAAAQSQKDEGRVLLYASKMTDDSEDSLAELIKTVKEGSPADRAEIEWLAECFLDAGSPRVAERCMPLLIAVMDYPDDSAQVAGICRWPAAEAVRWFFANTTLSVPSGPADLMACDKDLKASKIPRFVWPTNVAGARENFAKLREACQEWYKTRKGIIDFNRSKYSWLNVYYGREIEEVREPVILRGGGP